MGDGATAHDLVSSVSVLSGFAGTSYRPWSVKQWRECKKCWKTGELDGAERSGRSGFIGRNGGITLAGDRLSTH
jgi:hypothetical protein